MGACDHPATSQPRRPLRFGSTHCYPDFESDSLPISIGLNCRSRACLSAFSKKRKLFSLIEEDARGNPFAITILPHFAGWRDIKAKVTMTITVFNVQPTFACHNSDRIATSDFCRNNRGIPINRKIWTKRINKRPSCVAY
ncbi:hypothetical protein MFFC18_18650 [Mariniblastus fucicola]|uniref:Uncharacterized protein n=1 Tax=Mariniblastus fucicola TaxID=980251 RepID=A0A5B9P6U4_9BACT|nr:hypothetical protein MFFC18_18650 [Mariniblastus fucicola]